MELPDDKPTIVRFRPANRFEMENTGELVQMDTSSSRSRFFCQSKSKVIYPSREKDQACTKKKESLGTENLLAK